MRRYFPKHLTDLIEASKKGDKKALATAMFSAPQPPPYTMQDLDALLPDDMKTRDLVIPVGRDVPKTAKMGEANSKHYFYFSQFDVSANGAISDAKNHVYNYVGLQTIYKMFKNHKTAFLFCPVLPSNEGILIELAEVIRACNIPFLCVTDNKDLLNKFQVALALKTEGYKSIIGNALSFSSLPCCKNVDEGIMRPKVLLQVQTSPTNSST